MVEIAMRGTSVQSRSELLGQISRAGSHQEISDAGLEASRYLAEHPDDADVIAATEKLHRRGVRLGDPDAQATPWEIAAYMVIGVVLVFLPTVVVAVVFGRGLQEALVLGVLLGTLVIWEAAFGIAAGWQSFGKKAFRTLKNRIRSIRG